jgi:hypothetical protein
MVFYIDNDYKIHLTNPDNIYEEVTYDGDFFNDKCDEFIEGFRFVPYGHTWVRWDQVEFPGQMISPWIDAVYLDHIQAEYVSKQFKDAVNALSLLGIT